MNLDLFLVIAVGFGVPIGIVTGMFIYSQHVAKRLDKDLKKLGF